MVKTLTCKFSFIYHLCILWGNVEEYIVDTSMLYFVLLVLEYYLSPNQSPHPPKPSSQLQWPLLLPILSITITNAYYCLLAPLLPTLTTNTSISFLLYHLGISTSALVTIIATTTTVNVHI